MLFQSSIRKELARSFSATLVVLSTIILTIVLIRTLGQASKGYISPQEVMLIMAYGTLGRLPTILTLSIFIAAVSTLSRMYRDSEMLVWFASGRGLASFLGPFFRFAWPILVLIAVLSMLVWPWSNQVTYDMRERYEKRGDLDRVAPGQFQESSNGSRVFFIDSSSAGRSSGNNVFIASTEKGKSSVTTARSGHIEQINGAPMLILENGQRLENNVGQSSLKISQFETYGTRTGNSTALAVSSEQAKARLTHKLLQAPTPENLAELAWRLGLVLAAINLVVIAVALTNASTRSGRSSNLLVALFAFVVYNNLINLGQSWIFVGLVPFGTLLLALHGGVFLASLVWLFKRHWNWTFGTWTWLRPAWPKAKGRKTLPADGDAP